MSLPVGLIAFVVGVYAVEFALRIIVAIIGAVCILAWGFLRWSGRGLLYFWEHY